MWLLARIGSPTKSLLGLAQSSDYCAEEVGALLCRHSHTAEQFAAAGAAAAHCPQSEISPDSLLHSLALWIFHMSSSAFRKALMGAIESMIVSVDVKQSW